MAVIRPRRSVLRAALAGAAALLLGTPAPALAGVEGPCTASFNGVEVERIDSLDSPLELDAGDVLTFQGTDDAGTGAAQVEVIIAMVPVRSGATTYGPVQTEFTAALDLEDVAPYGVGLFRVRGTTDHCTAEAWVRVSGRFPFTTLTGLTAGGLALGGFAAQITAIASRRRWSALTAALGGVVTGAGAAGIAQQFGRLQLSIPSIAAVAGIAALFGAVLAALLTPRSGEGWLARRREGRARRRAIRYQARLEAARLDAERREAEAAALQGPPRPAAPDPAPSGLPRREAPVRDHDSPPPPAEGPAWCYVLAPADVFDLHDHTRTVGVLQPGKWYLAKRRVGGWVQVAFGDGAEGWVAGSAVHTHG